MNNPIKILFNNILFLFYYFDLVDIIFKPTGFFDLTSFFILLGILLLFYLFILFKFRNKENFLLDLKYFNLSFISYYLFICILFFDSLGMIIPFILLGLILTLILTFLLHKIKK